MPNYLFVLIGKFGCEDFDPQMFVDLAKKMGINYKMQITKKGLTLSN